jgi:catechol 2,3-dioxygenase-like lactoylglutathione lyase family enzyme
MFSFICLGTRDLERASRFYDATMAALGAVQCGGLPDPQLMPRCLDIEHSE